MTEIETLYGYLITKKDFQINTVEDITKKLPRYYADSVIDRFKKVEKNWKTKHPNGEIWFYDDMGILCGSNGLLMIDDDKVVEVEGIWRA
jgi:hypothetical protein